MEQGPEGQKLDEAYGHSALWRNNGDGTFTDVTDSTGLAGPLRSIAAIGTDYNNDRAVDVLVTGGRTSRHFSKIHERGQISANASDLTSSMPSKTNGVAAVDFDHDGWMDLAFTQMGAPGLTLWRNNHGKILRASESSPKPTGSAPTASPPSTTTTTAGSTSSPSAKRKTARAKSASSAISAPTDSKTSPPTSASTRFSSKDPRAIITGDYDNDGATDLLITQNHGPAVLLRNEGATQNHWLKLSLKGLNDNKSAIGTKVEVFSGGNRQKFEIYGSNGYLGQNSTDIVVGLGQSKEADIVRMLWPTGVLQDEIQIAGDKRQEFLEIDRRGSSCPTLFAWNGERYEFVADMLGAAVVGHWIGPNQRDIPRPVEYIKIPTGWFTRRIESSRLAKPARPAAPHE